MSLKLITPPAEEPLTLVEAKSFLRVDHDYADTDITGLIQSAREYAEKYQHRKLITQTWELYLDNWPSSNIIEIAPSLQSVESIKYINQTGTEAAFLSSSYLVDTVSLIGKVVLKSGKSWPSGPLQEANGIKIRFICGYGGASVVPGLTKTGMKVYISHRYFNRETDLEKGVKDAVDRLLDFEKVVMT